MLDTAVKPRTMHAVNMDVKPCEGKCGRNTRPAAVTLTTLPDTVVRYRDGMCSTCWELCQAMRPMTRHEANALQAYEAWCRARARRQFEAARRENARRYIYQQQQRRKFDKLALAETKRVDLLEQFAEEPVFKTLRVSSAYKRLKESKEANMNEHVEKHGNGTVRYIRDSRGEWRYSVLGENGEVMAQSEGYVSLRNAKRGAKRLADRLSEDKTSEPDA